MTPAVVAEMQMVDAKIKPHWALLLKILSGKSSHPARLQAHIVLSANAFYYSWVIILDP